MLYTVGYRGYTVWREDPTKPFRISRTEARDLATLKAKAEPTTHHDFANARREIDWLRG